MVSRRMPVAAALVASLALLSACGGSDTGPDAPAAPGSPVVPPGPSPSPSPSPAPAPSIVALNVRGGPTAGGTQVLAVATGLEPGVTVTVGGIGATGVAIVDMGLGSRAVSFFTPAHPEGLADVVVTNPDGQSDTWPGFHYGPAPGIAAITCSGGCDSVHRDDLITIEGAHFGAGTGEGVQVHLSSTDRPQQAVAVQVSASATQLVVVAPKLDPGLYSVVVNNWDGQYGVAVQRLTYSGP